MRIEVAFVMIGALAAWFVANRKRRVIAIVVGTHIHTEVAELGSARSSLAIFPTKRSKQNA